MKILCRLTLLLFSFLIPAAYSEVVGTDEPNAVVRIAQVVADYAREDIPGTYCSADGSTVIEVNANHFVSAKQIMDGHDLPAQGIFTVLKYNGQAPNPLKTLALKGTINSSARGFYYDFKLPLFDLIITAPHSRGSNGPASPIELLINQKDVLNLEKCRREIPTA